MRALSSASSFQCVVEHAACRRPLQAWLTALSRQQPRPAACRSISVRATLSSNGSSSADSGSNGWLLEAASSLDSATSTNGSNGSTSSSGGGANYDAIMVLGGGLLPNGGLPEWVLRRLEGGLHLYQQQAQLNATSAAAALVGGAASQHPPPAWQQQPSAGCPIVLLGAGTPHKPPVIDGGGYVLHESSAYAAYLMQRGVPAADLLKEAQSYDTVGNAYFSLLMHALPAGWRRIAIVTSEFHMLRTRATFDVVYQLAGRQLHGDAAWFSLDYRPVSDEGIFSPEVLEARAAKESTAVATWHNNTASMRGLADLHSWLYATHLCYSVSRQHEFGRELDLDPKLAATY